jgi:hypothetical protein
MANYAYVSNNEIVSVYDVLPANWQNISNFNALDTSTLQSLGWYLIENVVPNYDPSTQKLDNPTYYFSNNTAYQTMEVIDLPPSPSSSSAQDLANQQSQQIAQQWNVVRKLRGEMIDNVEWRITRYNRQIVLNVTPTDNINNLQTYIQALADVPQTNSDPFNITWPTLGD